MNDNVPYSPLNGLPEAWRDGLKEEVKRSAIAFVTIWALFFAVCAVFPDLRAKLVEMMFSTLNSKNLSGGSGKISVLALFLGALASWPFAYLQKRRAPLLSLCCQPHRLCPQI